MLEGRSIPATFAYMETLYPKTALGWAELRAVRRLMDYLLHVSGLDG